MSESVTPETRGTSLNRKIITPFLVILFILGLTAAVGSVRLISSALFEQANHELQAASKVIKQEILAQKALLLTFAEILQSSHITQPDLKSIDHSLQTVELGKTKLKARVITTEEAALSDDANLQQLVTLARRSDQHQLRVIDDHSGVPTFTLVQPVSESSGSYLLIQSPLDRAFLMNIADPLRVNVQILALDNRNLAGKELNSFSLPSLSNQDLKHILSGHCLFKRSEPDADVRYLFCAIPLNTTELILLSISRPMANLQSTVSTLTSYSAATVLIVLLIGGYVFYLILRRVMRPLGELLAATREIGTGNLDYQVDVASKDEFGSLASSFNLMVGEINRLYGQKVEQEKSLAQANEKLKYKEILEAKNSQIERTNQELRVHLKEISALFNLNQAMASSLEIGVLFDRMISVLKDLFHCNRIVLFTYDPGKEELVIRKSYGIDQETLPGTVFRLDEGITGKVALSQKLLYIPDLEADGRNLRYKGRSNSEGSLISVPLTIKNRLAGVLNLHKFNVYAFNLSDLKLVQAVANQAAVAIENSQLYEKARTLSNTDELTGLANRRHFQLILKREMAQAHRFQAHFTLIMADIDNFKAYNDTHGHLKGDNLLKKISKVLLQNTRGIDLVARFGGEEFVILLPKTDVEGGKMAAEKLRVSIMAENFPGGDASHPDGFLTISLGVAEYPSDSQDVYELLDLADRAMYRAKEAGKNQVIAWRDLLRPQIVAE